MMKDAMKHRRLENCKELNREKTNTWCLIYLPKTKRGKFMEVAVVVENILELFLIIHLLHMLLLLCC